MSDDQKDLQKPDAQSKGDQINIVIPKTSLTLSEVAACLNVSEDMVLKYIREKKLKAENVAGSFFITEENLKKFLHMFNLASNNSQDPLTEKLHEPSTTKYPSKPISLAVINRIIECLNLLKMKKISLGEELSSSLISCIQSDLELIFCGYFSYGASKIMFYNKAQEPLAKALSILYVNVDIVKHNTVIQAFVEISDALTALTRKVSNDRK